MKRLFFLLVLIATCAAVGCYFYVDRQIVARLVYHHPSGAPAILTDAWRINRGGDIAKEQLLKELRSRSYREVNARPTGQGEYFQQDTAFFVYSREFQAADGSQTSATLCEFEQQGSILLARCPQGLSLEPELLAHLGSGEVKAARYRALKEIPKPLIQAVVAVEDERFYNHYGVDLIGIARALLTNIRAGRIVQGGSTLTQQLAKNLLFTPRRTLGRKILEAFAAISLENRYSKDEIIELYLNEVYLGQEGAVAIHGMNEASRTFLGKDLAELNISEMALLAGMIRAPSYYAIRKNLSRATARRDTVLEKMKELGYITPLQMVQAKASKIRPSNRTLHLHRSGAHFITQVQHELSEYVNIDAALGAGLTIYSGIQRELQTCGEEALQNGLAQLERAAPTLKRKNHSLEGALVAIEPFSGKIRAWVGGRDYSENQFDHVAQAKRQVGSTIKAFLYLTALDSNLNSYRPATPITILPDEPLKFDQVAQPTWEPENYDHKFRGDVTLRYALEHSLNMPAAYIATRVGIPAFARVVHTFHLADQVPEVPSLALGTVDTTLLQLTAAYGALANGGNYVAPRLFLAARDTDNNALAVTALREERVADENAVFVLTNILQGVIERGTAQSVRALGFQGQVAGKTGTSNETRDAWFVGFHPGLVVGVWVGYDDNAKTGLTGGKAAVPIWTEFMKCAAKSREPVPFLQPPGVTIASIDLKSMTLATASCPAETVIKEYFVKGTEPLRHCPLHGGGSYDSSSDLDVDRFDSDTQQEEDRSKRRRSIWDILLGR